MWPLIGFSVESGAIKEESTRNEENSRQRESGRAKGAAKGSCGETPFLLCSLCGFQDLSGVLIANLKGAEKKRTLQKHPFGQPFFSH